METNTPTNTPHALLWLAGAMCLVSLVLGIFFDNEECCPDDDPTPYTETQAAPIDTSWMNHDSEWYDIPVGFRNSCGDDEFQCARDWHKYQFQTQKGVTATPSVKPKPKVKVKSHNHGGHNSHH